MVRKRWSIFKIKESEPNVLYNRIFETLADFPLLKQIYDEEFIQKLIQRRFELDNALLWNLASKEPVAIATLGKIESALETLKDVDGLEKFKSKLRQWDQISFASAFLEIDFACHYKENYTIEIEPSISGTSSGPDLKVETGNGPIFFEIKNVLSEQDKQNRKFWSLVTDKIGKTTEKYVFSVRMLKSPDMSVVDPLKKFVGREFKKLSEKGIEKAKLRFPENDPTVEIDIRGRPKKLDYGYLASSSSGFSGRDDSGNIRKKIKGKIRQLPKGEMNVVVIECLDPFVDLQDDFIDAVIGQDVMVINIETGRTKPKRGHDRIFRSDMYTRISAICAYRKTFEDGKWNNQKFILHNPFAEKNIPPDFFNETNTKQFLRDDGKSTAEFVEFKIIGEGYENG